MGIIFTDLILLPLMVVLAGIFKGKVSVYTPGRIIIRLLPPAVVAANRACSTEAKANDTVCPGLVSRPPLLT